MKKRILALDLGGTSVKAAIYAGDSIENITQWEHSYNDCSQDDAKDHLITRINEFCNTKIDAIGLSVAGLIGTDDSLYMTTVLRSFQGFNLPKFLREQLTIDVVTIDNDADCGAVSALENSRNKNNFLYVVIGSGIGSAFIRHDGTLPYRKRFDPNHEFSENDNPIPNDLGLLVAVQKSYINKIFGKSLDTAIADYDGKPLTGPNDDPNSVRVDRFASARGIKNILEMLFSHNHDKGLTHRLIKAHYKNEINCHPYYEVSEEELNDLHNEKKVAKLLGRFAKQGEYYAKEAFKHFGHFLGYGIAEVAKIIQKEQSMRNQLEVVLAGPILASYGNNARIKTIQAIDERQGCCRLYHNYPMVSSNTEGACIMAAKELRSIRPFHS